MEHEAIDFVIPWVDGADPAWRAEKARYAGEVSSSPFAEWVDGEQRYRDNGLLRYWFRGVEKFAPWVNRIHFVTWGHLPSWLDTSHPKLHVVSHRDYIPPEYLPTFSSHCIELNFHRIDGLAEQFVYFNDDMYLTAPTVPGDFFRGGLPRDSAIISPIHLRNNGIRAEINAMYIVNERFRKREVLKANPLKWFAPCYGKALVRTLTQLPYGLFTGFFVTHLPVSYLKSTFEEVWKAVPETMERACRHRFRDDSDVNQWLMQYWQYCTGRFSPRSPSVGMMYEGAECADAAVRDIGGSAHRMICWNDSPDLTAGIDRRIISAFDRLLPERCGFERHA